MITDMQEIAAAPADENKIIAERRVKLATLRDKGIAFPNDFRPQHKAAACTPPTARKRAKNLKPTRCQWCWPGA